MGNLGEFFLSYTLYFILESCDFTFSYVFGLETCNFIFLLCLTDILVLNIKFDYQCYVCFISYVDTWDYACFSGYLVCVVNVSIEVLCLHILKRKVVFKLKFNTHQVMLNFNPKRWLVSTNCLIWHRLGLKDP